MTKYKVIRSYSNGQCMEQNLKDAFDDGYEFVHASEYILPETIGGTFRYGYIEYILRKEYTE